MRFSCVKTRWPFASVLLALLLAAIPLFTGCSGGGGSKSVSGIAESSPTPDPFASVAVAQTGWTLDNSLPAQPTRKWTVLVYLNAANDLEPYATTNMAQMESIGSTADVNVVVQYKRMGGEYDTSGGTWTDTRRYFVTKGGATLLSQQSGVDMGSAQTLSDFVTWATKAYPAQHYMIDLWSHGNGWRAEAVHTGLVRGVSYDDATGNHITVPQLSGALTPLGSKWDLVAFDACLMQMAEIGYEIKDQAQYVVGSEADTPADGYPYDTILQALTTNTAWTGLEFGKEIAADTISSYASAETDVAQSLVSTAGIANLASTVDALGSVLLAKTTASATMATEIATIRSYARNYDSDYPDFRDLATFARLIAAPVTSDVSYGYTVTRDATITSAAANVLSALNASVVADDPGTSYTGSGGLTLYLPTPRQYQSDLHEQQENADVLYANLKFASAAPNWLSFLVSAPK